MDAHVKDFSRLFSSITNENAVDLSSLSFMRPWDIGIVCLLLVERSQRTDRKIILPNDVNVLRYLKRLHLNVMLKELGYEKELRIFDQIPVVEQDDPNLHEITHCRYVDEFNARLGHFERMFRNFGLNDEDAKRALVIFGELGNNVFDHNLGNWPTNFSGSIVVAQNYPELKRIECVVGDSGVGFFGSLRAAFPKLQTDIQAIQKGLGGYTGRIGEKRGNGLKTIQDWTINDFHGILNIHSGKGLVQVDESGIEAIETNPLLGTLAQFVIYYR